MLKHAKVEKKYVFFRLFTSVGQIKNSESPSDSSSLSHTDFRVSEVYYEIHMTRVLHTDRINNVDSVMFLNIIREIASSELVKGLILHGDPEFFLCPRLVTGQKKSFFLSLPSSKFTISPNLLTNMRILVHNSFSISCSLQNCPRVNNYLFEYTLRVSKYDGENILERRTAN